MNLPIPSGIFDQNIITLGKTRSGKSSAMRLMVESLLDQEKPVCIIDPKGDWWGLKSSGDGKKPGYSVVIFGGEHADIPINRAAGSGVAELFATGNRPCIIDLGGWMVSERTQFFVDFSSTLFRMTRGRRWLVIDEVHNFTPKGKIYDPEAGKMLHWANRLASEGLGKGVALIAASQRPQKVHNDFLTSCETLIAMRVIHKSDRDAIDDWIMGAADPVVGKKVLAELASMKRGEAWAWSPEINFGPERIRFPMFHTYDSFKPQLNEQPAKLTGWADVDLEEVKSKLSAVVKEAESKNPVKLQARIRELENELRSKPASIQVVKQEDPKRIERAVGRVHKEHINSLKRARTRIVSLGRLPVTQFAETYDSMIASIDLEIEAIQKGSGQEMKEGKQDKIPALFHRSHPGPKIHPIPRERSTNTNHLPVGERAVLIAAAQYPDGVDKRTITILSGYKRSSRDAYILRLKNKSMIDEVGDKVVATEEGIATLGSDYDPLPTGSELQDYWLKRLPEGERKVLEILIREQGPVARDKIDEETGYQRSSRDAYLLRLGARQLVDKIGRGEVQASATLFD